MKKYFLMAMICLVSLGVAAQRNNQYPSNPQNHPQGQYDQHHHNDGHHDQHQPARTKDYQDGYRDGYRDGQKDAQHQGHHDQHHHQPAPAPAPIVASAEQQQWAVQMIQKQSYDDKRMEVAKLCVVLCPFTVRDLARMAGCFTMEDRKVDFLIFAYKYCPDPENYYMLRDVLRYKSDYDKLMERVQPGGYHRP